MPLSRSRDYLSIGEVLDVVRPDFPDVSISKIRFLESEGLLEPERTQSGYRKFYEKDVERLRYILTLQRDHFMPLRVIKDKITQGGAVSNGAVLPPAAVPTAPSLPAESSTTPELTGVQMDRSELLGASGLTEAQLAGLEDYGVLAKQEQPYDEGDLMVARAAKGFLDLGVEPRHLRMYRQITDRELGFFEQLVAPSAQRKDADAARRAGETLLKLASLSRTMREGLLQAAVRDSLQ